MRGIDFNLVDRSIPVVEELWESPSHRYPVEHTCLESYSGQIENDAKLRGLLVPVREFLIGRFPDLMYWHSTSSSGHRFGTRRLVGDRDEGIA